MYNVLLPNSKNTDSTSLTSILSRISWTAKLRSWNQEIANDSFESCISNLVSWCPRDCCSSDYSDGEFPFFSYDKIPWFFSTSRGASTDRTCSWPFTSRKLSSDEKPAWIQLSLTSVTLDSCLNFTQKSNQHGCKCFLEKRSIQNFTVAKLIQKCLFSDR